MKKILIVAGVAVMAVSAFSSCKKTYRCSCTTTMMVNDTVRSTSTTKRDYRTTKADARNKCSSWSQHTETGGQVTHTQTDCMFE